MGEKKIDMLILFSVCLASLLIHTPLGSFGGHCTGEGRQDRGAAGFCVAWLCTNTRQQSKQTSRAGPGAQLAGDRGVVPVASDRVSLDDRRRKSGREERLVGNNEV